MEYIQLGNSDLKVSRICLGCMGFGDAKNGQHTWTIDEQHTREIVKKAFFGPITPEVPASVLQLHNDVVIVADQAALSKMPK